MGYKQIKYEVSNHILTITLNRPELLNAWTSIVMAPEIVDALNRAESNDDIRVIIFTGAGRAFCAGADLSRGLEKTFNYSQETIDTHQDSGGIVTLRIFNMKKPIIAALNGPAVGVGITMTLPMDIRLASTKAKIGFVFSTRGIVLEACSSWYLPRIVGISKAAEWAYTGRIFDAEEALRAGLISEVLPPEQLIIRARDIGKQIVENTSAISVALNRQLLWQMLGANHPAEAHLIDSKLMFWAGQQDDAKEGITSFLEKRPPKFPLKLSRDMPPFFH